MSVKSRTNLFLGLFFLAASLVLIFVWIPLDTDTGIVEKARGRFVIGDALAPTVAAGFILIGAFVLLVFERGAPDQPRLDLSQIKFIASLAGVIIISFVVMRYTGPLLSDFANMFRENPMEYRLLRDTPGWKHVGFVLGGVMMISGIVAIVERGFSRRAVITGIFAVFVLIAVFDLPFEDLLLPPNGDV